MADMRSSFFRKDIAAARDICKLGVAVRLPWPCGQVVQIVPMAEWARRSVYWVFCGAAPCAYGLREPYYPMAVETGSTRATDLV